MIDFRESSVHKDINDLNQRRAERTCYIIAKGWEGFCDRLQILSNCIDVAISTGRTIHVDWNDRIWTHDNRGFFDYFNIVGLPVVTLLTEIPYMREVHPVFYKGGLGLQTDEWMYDIKHHLVFDATNTEKVLVNCGIGFRTHNFNTLIKHLRIVEEVKICIKSALLKVPQELPVVHLRGTDRPVDETCWEDLRSRVPIAAVVSDDLLLGARWMKESPSSILLSNSLIDSLIAPHKLSAEALANFNLTKHQLNIGLITDFFVIAQASTAYTLNNSSLFFQMARLFGACGGTKLCDI